MTKKIIRYVLGLKLFLETLSVPSSEFVTFSGCGRVDSHDRLHGDRLHGDHGRCRGDHRRRCRSRVVWAAFRAKIDVDQLQVESRGGKAWARVREQEADMISLKLF